MLLIRLFIISILSILINVQFCFGQRARSDLKPYHFEYSDSTKKILPADEKEFIIDLRMLSDDILEKYKNDPEFDYDGGPKEAEDWISKIKNWINQQLAILRSSKAYSTLLDYLYYGLMIAALILIVRGLIKADRRGLLFGKINSNEIKIIESEEDISQINFDELISIAIESKQYKLAVRYLFLNSLKLLSEKGLIELKNNKTNYQYLSEIKNNQIADVFRNTTSSFEWIWYGDFPVDENIMKSSQNDFSELFGLIAS
ncbi:MAG: hypothetical protein A2W30_00930 [Ignavibacteria bacterium RBG_16_36_9]|nr:MAG: hypothetical protein A2W30_00930 [Ignavibacteria bacterium RBG_16_36_9]